MERILALFISLFPILGGAAFISAGLLIDKYLEEFLLFLTHRPIPDEVNQKSSMKQVKTLVRRIGFILQLLGYGLIIYGSAIFVVGVIGGGTIGL